MSHALTGRPIMQKTPRYENRKLLDLCRGEPCELNYPGCTGGTNPDRPSVPCHPNWLEDGKGVGYKGHDHLAVPGCPDCHYQHDQGTLYTTEQKKEVHDSAHKRYFTRRLTEGRVTLKVAA
jgi:hypothetical protein